MTATLAQPTTARPSRRRSYRVAGLFAGIGGIEVGLQAAGHRTTLLSEIDPSARAVLRARFPEIMLGGDVRAIEELGDIDLVSAGFPCQDLSQAGRTNGIGGERSGLVGQVFRLLEKAEPTWLVLENVPFMLQLDRGLAMRHLTEELGRLGFRWAYRVVDARAFGLPQRRQRVILLASRSEEPADVLFADDASAPQAENHLERANGFYWTEGVRGLGWAVDAVPTLKGGSTIGIPSPPAVWTPDGLIGTPHITDAERLQGFEAGWTLAAAAQTRGLGARWKMVGNAVSVPLAKWIGERLAEPGQYIARGETALTPGDPWPRAARGCGTDAVRVERSVWPITSSRRHLLEFLQEPLKPLSIRASEGFLSRTERASLRFPEGLIPALRDHLEGMRKRELIVGTELN